MQLVSSRIWTRVAMSISYDDNHYTTGTSTNCSFIANFSNRQSTTVNKQHIEKMKKDKILFRF